MKKIAILTAKIGMVLIGLMAVVMVGYGLYQQSQLYPMVHQQAGYKVGYQQCVSEVQAAQQQALNQQENEQE